jgi:methyltransferase
MVMHTRGPFIALLFAVALQRVLELRESRRHERALLAAGAREHAPGHFVWMRALHASWLVATGVEVLVFSRPFIPALAAPAACAFVAGQALRHAARRALGPRWTARIVTLPGAPPVTRGIYRYVRHPNYAGVVLELAALPLIHGAFVSAAFFSAANALLLLVRIRHEERALAVDSGGSTELHLRPRFLPRVGGASVRP